MKLFTNQSVNGTSLSFENAGGRRQVVVQGVLDGASIQPQIIQDDLPPIDFGNPITTEVGFRIELLQCDIQFVLSAAGASTNINLSVV
jgi:hypothetical protein